MNYKCREGQENKRRPHEIDPAEYDNMSEQDLMISVEGHLLEAPESQRSRKLSSSSNYMEEADAFDRHLVELEEHTARYVGTGIWYKVAILYDLE